MVVSSESLSLDIGMKILTSSSNPTVFVADSYVPLNVYMFDDWVHDSLTLFIETNPLWKHNKDHVVVIILLVNATYRSHN